MLVPWLVLLAFALGPPSKAEVEVESLPFDPAALKAMDQVEVKVTEREKIVIYRGVPLASLLAEKAGKKPGMADLRRLADAVVLVRAEDDYQVAVSAAAAAMDPDGSRYLLALSRDGRPLGEGQGPAKLIIPGDPQHVRWVRMVSAIDLVRLPRSSLKGAKTPGR